MSERVLWARSLEHDARAFAALFELHRDRVFRRAARLVESATDAEDVTAAAFLELWRQRARVRLVDESVLPWLLVTTSNLSRNSRRGLARYRTMLRGLPRESVNADPTAIVEERMERAAGGRAVAAALQRLAPADAALVVLVVLEGFRSDQAAAALGIAPGTARNRMVRIRRRLRAELGETRTPQEPAQAELARGEGEPR